MASNVVCSQQCSAAVMQNLGEGPVLLLVLCSEILWIIDFNRKASKSHLHAFDAICIVW